MKNESIPNWVRNFKQFIASCGVYCKSIEESKFIIEVLGITPTNVWGSSKKEGSQKRKFLVCYGVKWKFATIDKYSILDELNIDDFKEMLRDVINYTRSGNDEEV